MAAVNPEPDRQPGPGGPRAGPLEGLREPPVFIVGHHRSGTTWVYDLLTQRPDVAGVLESWLFTPGVGVAGLFDPRHWDPERLRHYRGVIGRPFGLASLMTRDELLVEVRSFVERVLGRAVEQHHSFLVEKTPSPYTDVELLAEALPGARLVHVVRDGRDVAVSVRAAAHSWNPGWRYAAGNSLRRYSAFVRLGHSWARSIRALRDLGRRLGSDRYLEVRYEELHARPAETLRRLFRFCGMPFDDQLLVEVLAAGDFTRLRSGEDRFRRAGRVGDWRRSFGLLDALAFERGSGGALLEAGYARRRSWWARPPIRLRGA